MLKATDTKTIYDYSLPGDEDNPTVFKIHALTGREKLHCMSITGVDAIMSLTDAIKFGLVGWVNYADHDGKQIAFNPDDLDWCIDQLDESIIAALSNEILNVSTISDEDKKKSD